MRIVIALLRAESLDVVTTAGNPAELLTAVDEHRPDVAIVDVRMPPTHTDEGIVAAVAARRRHPGLAVLVLSAYVEQAFATDLLAGGAAIDPDVVAQLLSLTRQDTALARLSPRERDVLVLMAEGLGNTAIAERLFVTEGAIHKHIRSIFAKLDLSPDDRTDRRGAAVLHYLDNAHRG